MPKHFTHAEAEAMLPRVTPLLREIQMLRASLVQEELKMAALRQKMLGNGHQHRGELQQLHARISSLTAEVAEHLEQIQALGIEIKDLDTGLIDFPCMREGRTVLLCWRLGEDRIAWWHEIDAGFRGRQPLDD